MIRHNRCHGVNVNVCPRLWVVDGAFLYSVCTRTLMFCVSLVLHVITHTTPLSLSHVCRPLPTYLNSHAMYSTEPPQLTLRHLENHRDFTGSSAYDPFTSATSEGGHIPKFIKTEAPEEQANQIGYSDGTNLGLYATSADGHEGAFASSASKIHHMTGHMTTTKQMVPYQQSWQGSAAAGQLPGFTGHTIPPPAHTNLGRGYGVEGGSGQLYGELQPNPYPTLQGERTQNKHSTNVVV